MLKSLDAPLSQAAHEKRYVLAVFTLLANFRTSILSHLVLSKKILFENQELKIMKLALRKESSLASESSSENRKYRYITFCVFRYKRSGAQAERFTLSVDSTNRPFAVNSAAKNESAGPDTLLDGCIAYLIAQSVFCRLRKIVFGLSPCH